MQLLAPSEVKRKKKADDESDQIKRDQLSREISKHTRNLNQISKTDILWEKKREEFAKWEMQTLRTKAELEGEVAGLIAKKRIALSPIMVIQEELDKRTKELSAQEKFLNQRNSTLDKREAEIETQRKVADESISKSMDSLNVKMLANQKLEVERGRLREEISIFNQNKERFDSYLADEQTKLADEKIHLELEGQRLSVLEDALVKEGEELGRQRIQIADQRVSLQAAWDELKAKYGERII